MYWQLRYKRNRQLFRSFSPLLARKKAIRRKYRWKYPKRLLKIDELSEMIGMSKSCIYTWVSQEKIPVVKCGRAVRFDPVAIESWIKDNQKKPKYRM